MSRRSIVSAAEEANKVRSDAIRAAQVPQIGPTGNFGVTGTLPEYNINYDPTYAGTIGVETGYQGAPQTAGNVGPSAGESWTGGISGGVVKEPYKTVFQRAQEAGEAAAAQPGFTEDKLRARQQAEANVYAQAQVEQQAQKAATDAATRQMAQGAGAATLGGSQALSGQSFAGDRQSYIAKRRAEGINDQQIRTELSSGNIKFQPVGSVPSTTPTNAPEPTKPVEVLPITPTVEPVLTATPEKVSKTEVPQAFVPPSDNAFDSLIAGTIDPQLQAVLRAMKAESSLISPPSQEQFLRDAAQIASPYDAMQRIVDQASARLQQGERAMKGFLAGQYERNDKYLAAQQENQLNQLTFANQKAVRDQTDVNKKNLDAQTIMLALQGGFGSADGNREIAEARAKGEEAIIDLNKEFGFKKTDVSLAFTQSHEEAYNKYQTDWLKATDDFETRISNLDVQGLSNQQAKASAVNSAYKDYVGSIKDARVAQAKSITDATKLVYSAINQERDDKRMKEEKALDRIEYLLKNYPRESVAGAIREIGKNVTSFDVSVLADNPTLAEIDKARKSVRGIGSRPTNSFSDFLPFEMQDSPVPDVSYDDFTLDKIDELQLQQQQSLSPDKRAKLIAENEVGWRKEYEALYVSPLRGQGVSDASGQIRDQLGQDVLTAAELVLNGTYGGTNPIKRSADAQGVKESAVAIAVNKLRQNGYTLDTKTLSPDQNKSWDGIRSELGKDTFYSVWNGSKSAVSRIQTAINTGGGDGIADIMAINAFQNGIVDPGATVREGDVTLMQTAIAWAEIVKLDYWKEKITKGAKMPDSMRQKMLQLAQSTEQAYGRDFQSTTLPKMKTLIRQKGLPQSVLDDFLGSSESVSRDTSVLPSTRSFVDSLKF